MDKVNAIIMLLMGFIMLIAGIHGFIFGPEELSNRDNIVKCYDKNNNIIMGESCLENKDHIKGEYYAASFFACLVGSMFLVLGSFEFVYSK